MWCTKQCGAGEGTQLHVEVVVKAWKFLDNSVFSKNEKSEAFFRRKTNEKRKKYKYIKSIFCQLGNKKED